MRMFLGTTGAPQKEKKCLWTPKSNYFYTNNIVSLAFADFKWPFIKIANANDIMLLDNFESKFSFSHLNQKPSEIIF